MIRVSLPALLLAASISAAGAQAPVITPDGDPSVRADTIYRLAVSPDAFPDESWIFLLDDGVVTVSEDGRGRRTYRYVAQILKQEAVEPWAENSFSYNGARQRFTLNWMRVVRPDGSVITPGPTHQQTSGPNVPTINPVYTDSKVHRATIGGVAPGTIVDYSYTIEDLEPLVRGDFQSSWSITTGRPVMLSRFILDVPASITPRIVERNLTFSRSEKVHNGRRTYTWATRDVPKPPFEPFASDSNNTAYQSVLVSGNIDWSDIARWYAPLANDLYAMTPELEQRLAELVRGKPTLLDSLRAVHQWIAQDVRYVSLSLGLGGYQPRPPSEVLETTFGDCKDKTTLFVTMARGMGLNAWPVLTNATARVNRLAPSVRQFDHMIAAVELPERVYVDLTASFTPWAQLPSELHEEYGLLVRDDGSSERVELPGDPQAPMVRTVIRGTISPTGEFSGRFTQEFLGSSGENVRSTFARDITPRERDEMLRSLAAGVYTGGRADSLELFDGRDLNAEPRIGFTVTGARAARLSQGSAVLPILIDPPDPSESIAALSDHMPRKFWIASAAVFGIGRYRRELYLTLPEDWRARLPRSVTASSEFGTYIAEYAQEGRELRIVREQTGSRAIMPPDSVTDLISWLERIAEDDATFILIDRPTAGRE